MIRHDKQNPARVARAKSTFLEASTFQSWRSLLCLSIALLLVMEQRCLGMSGYEIIKDFGDPSRMGWHPSGRLTEGPGGYLYGTTDGIADNMGDDGTVYRMKPDGSEYEVVHRFDRANGAIKPKGHLLLGSDGLFYGTVTNGSEYGRGAVYKFDPATRAFVVVKQLEMAEARDIVPYAGLLEGNDGMLYGTALGTPAQPSIVFKVGRDGAGYQVIKVLPRIAETATLCEAPLLEASDGMLYGACRVGGQNGTGYLFRLEKDGEAFEIIRQFGSGSSTPAFPAGGLIEGSDGQLYGLLSAGINSTAGDGGAVFKIGKNGTGYSVLKVFLAADGVWGPVGELIESSDGRLHGVLGRRGSANRGGYFRLNKGGSNYASTRNESFDATPAASLIQTQDGWFRGIAVKDGVPSVGFVFGIAPDGTFSQTLRFSGTGHESPHPGELVKGIEGWLYGVTRGATGEPSMLFRIREDGTQFERLRILDEVTEAGFRIGQGLAVGPDGYLYLSAYGIAGYSRGGIVRLTATGEVDRLLVAFESVDGEPGTPTAWMVHSDGNLYGVCRDGGMDFGGVLFRVGTDGSGFTILHHFSYGNGYSPRTAPCETSDGMLVGAVSDGIYSIRKDGTDYSYASFPLPIGSLLGGVVSGDGGMFYGCAISSESTHTGVIYAFDRTNREFSILRHFQKSPQGQIPLQGSLVFSPQGYLYGSAGKSSSLPGGMIFRIKLPEGDYQAVYQPAADMPGVSDVPDTMILGGGGFLFGSSLNGGKYALGSIIRYDLSAPVTPVPLAILEMHRSSLGWFTLRFSSEAGQTYRIEYSDDCIEWKISPETVPAVGLWSEWQDTGPPTTDSAPGPELQRFYRVELDSE